MIRKTQPKVIVLDVGLPDIDGFDVVSVLRRDEHVRRLPLLVYSGRDLGSDERAKLKLGPTRFLTKATSDDHEFRRNVLELIGSASAEQAV
jgi:CheY-like chemotaxis protein